MILSRVESRAPLSNPHGNPAGIVGTTHLGKSDGKHHSRNQFLIMDIEIQTSEKKLFHCESIETKGDTVSLV